MSMKALRFSMPGLALLVVFSGCTGGSGRVTINGGATTINNNASYSQLASSGALEAFEISRKVKSLSTGRILGSGQ